MSLQVIIGGVCFGLIDNINSPNLESARSIITYHILFMVSSAILSQMVYICIGPGDSDNAQFIEKERRRKLQEYQIKKKQNPKVKPPEELSLKEQEL